MIWMHPFAGSMAPSRQPHIAPAWKPISCPIRQPSRKRFATSWPNRRRNDFMAVEITVPRLGWNMEEGIFVGWLKRDGETVAAGEPLFSLEGDKATQDVESLETGIVHIPPDGPKDGEKVVVGAVIGYVIGAGESAPARTRTEGQS